MSFDRQAGQLPEGVAVDRVGNVFVSLAPLGQVVRVEPGSDEAELIGAVPGVDPQTDFGLLGLAIDARGNVYGAAVSKAAQGVWRFDRHSGRVERLPGTEKIGFPNSLAFDKRGNLYVTSSFEGRSPSGERLGGVWRIRYDAPAEPWLVDEVLGGVGEVLPPNGIGANGIAYRHGSLFVSNSEKASIVAIPIAPDGTAGEPRVVVQDPALYSPDGITFDPCGRIYVAVINQSAIKRVDRDGSIHLIADADDGLDWPSTLAFGTTGRDHRSLYAVNFAIGESFGAPRGAGPALLRIAVEAPGKPLS